MAEARPGTSELVERWRALVGRYKNANARQEKCAALRDILQEVDYHLEIGKVSKDCHEKLRGKYEKEYKKIMAEVAKTVEIDVIGRSMESRHVEDGITNVDDDSNVGNGRVNGGMLNVMPTSNNGINALNVVRNGTIDGPNIFGSERPVCGNGSVSGPAPDVVIEKVNRIIEMPKKPLADGNILACWNVNKKSERKDDSSGLRSDKRKYVSDSPVSNKTVRIEREEKCDFLTAREQLQINNLKKNNGTNQFYNGSSNSTDWSKTQSTDSLQEFSAYGKAQKSLGARRGLSSKFVPPIPNSGQTTSGQTQGNVNEENPYTDPLYQDDRLKNCEPRMIELILNEILDNGPKMSWDDIAGLQFAKKTIQEIVVWPMFRPDIFTGLRGPPKGLLLFGPPGNGKTIIGKCIASQSNSTFFTISASSLTSKWVGEGEKMVRTLFAVARCHQPAVVFIDEIDSLLTQRSDQEHESSRRIKTEFLVQLDGACTASDERLLVIGATNRPHEIDEAARRRFVKRLYIPLPESEARCQIVRNLLVGQSSEISESELETIGRSTDGYSGADMANLCREAALGPIRSIPFGEIHNIAAEDVRPIRYCDFVDALEHVKASVSSEDLNLYIEWNDKFGSGRR